jgi:hypothetical protein
MGYDAILIPGGGVLHNGKLPLWVTRRLDLAINIYQGEYIITLSAGTTHKPPVLDVNGFVIFESIAGANYLLKNGIPPGNILTEISSYDTIGNAYFARFMHTEILGLKNLLIITSEFHLVRVKSIFDWIFNLDNSFEYNLDFLSVPDTEIPEDILQSRLEKEQESLTKLLLLKQKITNLQDLHKWLFSKHKAYTVGLQGNVIKQGKKFEMY